MGEVASQQILRAEAHIPGHQLVSTSAENEPFSILPPPAPLPPEAGVKARTLKELPPCKAAWVLSLPETSWHPEIRVCRPPALPHHWGEGGAGEYANMLNQGHLWLGD